MARPLSDERRNAILEAAASLVAEQGLSTPTAEIARMAGVPNGSVFTYFSTKTELFNALYLDLKTELTDAVLEAIATETDVQSQLRRLWMTWTQWGSRNPISRKALAQLSVSDQITPASRKAAAQHAAPTIDLIMRASARGALRKAPPHYVTALIDSMAATTIDFMINDPTNADELSRAGLHALLKMLI